MIPEKVQKAIDCVDQALLDKYPLSGAMWPQWRVLISHIAAQDAEIERRHGIGGELIIARRERDDAIAERDALQARIDSAPVGQSLGMVIYHHDETIAAKMEGKRVALVAGE